MILPRPIRKLLAVFRGGLSPLLIVLSITLGFTFGLIPGFSGIHVVILILFLALNIHFWLFLVSAALAKALCLAAAPLMYHFGQAVHNHLPQLLTFLAKIPIVGLTDFSRYSVAAAIVLGPVIGICLGFILSHAVTGFRKGWLKLEAGSDRFKKWTANRWVRLTDRILIGKRTADVEAALKVRSPLIRKAGVILAIGLLIIAAVFSDVLKNETLTDYATDAMTKANGAEVNLEKLDLSLLKGRIAAAGIQVTDPEKPQYNRIAIEKISTNAGIYSALCGKLILENVELANVAFGQPRQTPGKVLTADTEPNQPTFDPNDYEVESADAGKLEKYFKNAKQIKQWFQKVRKWLPKPKDKAKTRPETVPEHYLEYLRAKAQRKPAPRMMAKRIALDRVELPSTPFGNCRILLTNISDAPQAAAMPVRIAFASNQSDQSLDMTCHFESEDDVPELTGTFENIDLQKLQSMMSSSNKLLFQGGTASGAFSGKVSSESIDLKINVQLSDLQAASQGKGIFALDAKSTSEIFDSLNSLHVELRLVGPTTQPRLVFDSKGLTDQFKDALLEAGKKRIKKEIDDKLQKSLGDKPPGKLQEITEKPGELLKGIGDLFGGKKKKQ